MALRLVVMRHAKSSWHSGAASDHSRPLNDRGRTDAPRVADRLAQAGWVPHAALSSDATRTRQTWQLLSSRWLGEIPVRFTPLLYGGALDTILDAMALAAPVAGPLLVLGHNPTWEDLVAWLSGRDTTLKTANAALLEHDDAGWYQALMAQASWRLQGLVRPR